MGYLSHRKPSIGHTRLSHHRVTESSPILNTTPAQSDTIRPEMQELSELLRQIELRLELG